MPQPAYASIEPEPELALTGTAELEAGTGTGTGTVKLEFGTRTGTRTGTGTGTEQPELGTGTRNLVLRPGPSSRSKTSNRKPTTSARRPRSTRFRSTDFRRSPMPNVDRRAAIAVEAPPSPMKSACRSTLQRRRWTIADRRWTMRRRARLWCFRFRATRCAAIRAPGSRRRFMPRASIACSALQRRAARQRCISPRRRGRLFVSTGRSARSKARAVLSEARCRGADPRHHPRAQPRSAAQPGGNRVDLRRARRRPRCAA